jgi:murein DD-endopeptidase MepM/ murein hydrolase activator NlpD
VNGPVLVPHSVEALAYDETMDDWRTHAGMDIGVELGCRVLATANGTVTAVYEDDLMGTTVEIDHGNGLVSIYSNLDTMPAVKVGDKVTTGTLIGAVGNTAAAERGRAPHLHFAMLKNNKTVNPENYLPEK